MLEPGKKLNNSWSKLYALYAKLCSLISDVKASPSPLFSLDFCVCERTLIYAGSQAAHKRTRFFFFFLEHALMNQRRSADQFG